MMELDKLVSSCISKYNVDVNSLRDISFALCFADRLDGTNQKELDCDRFIASSSSEFNNVLKLLKIEPKTNGLNPLPRVQFERIVSDSLSILLNDKVSDLRLSSKSASLVAKVLGIKMESDDYFDEASCEQNLKKLQGIAELNGSVQKVLKILKTLGVPLPNGVSELPLGYNLGEYANSFREIDKSVFDEGKFIEDMNNHFVGVLKKLPESSTIIAYGVFSDIQNALNGKKFPCRISSDMHRSISGDSRYVRILNSLNKVFNITYSTADVNSTLILIIALYANNVSTELKRNGVATGGYVNM